MVKAEEAGRFRIEEENRTAPSSYLQKETNVGAQVMRYVERK